MKKMHVTYQLRVVKTSKLMTLLQRNEKHILGRETGVVLLHIGKMRRIKIKFKIFGGGKKKIGSKFGVEKPGNFGTADVYCYYSHGLTRTQTSRSKAGRTHLVT